MTPEEIEQLTSAQQIIIIEQLSSVQLQHLTTEQAVAFGLINGQGQEEPPRHSQQSSRWQNVAAVDNSTVTQYASANLTATANSTNITTSQISTATENAAPEETAEYGKKFKRSAFPTDDDGLVSGRARGKQVKRGGSIRMTGLMKERSNLERVVKA
jgi:hypothetical protein